MPADVSRLRGIGRYVQELIRAISKNHPRVKLTISFNAAMIDEVIAGRNFVRRWVDARKIHMWNGVEAMGRRCSPLSSEDLDGIS
jgi:hypothetical protein